MKDKLFAQEVYSFIQITNFALAYMMSRQKNTLKAVEIIYGGLVFAQICYNISREKYLLHDESYPMSSFCTLHKIGSTFETIG